MAHKKHIDNVIISKPQKFGNMWYFNMLNKTKEFNFDHESDHIQGMLLMEVARQAGIATIHLNGLSMDGKLNMNNVHTKFHNYVEYDSPVQVRSISSNVIFDQNSYNKNYAIVNCIQFGKICTTTYFEGIVFEGKDVAENYTERCAKINHKVKVRYQNLLNEFSK